MAGDWIKIETVTPDKPEVFLIADELGIDPDAVFGKLFRIWSWADQHTEDGNANNITRGMIDRLAGVSGFADAMAASGWLVEDGSHVTFPNFERHNGLTAKKRANNAKRAARSRENGNADVTLPSRSSATKSAPREEKRREEISITNVIDRDDWPKELQTDQFETAWTEWNDYRRQAKIKKYTAAGAKKQLNKLAALGVGRAIAAIDHSMAQGYQGIFEEKSSGRSNNSLSIGPGQRHDPNSGPAEF